MSSASERPVAGAAAAPIGHLGGSWSHRLARICVRPLLGTAVTPNHVTTVRLLTGLAACLAVALGTPAGDLWGGILWVLSAFLDRADGELARIGGKTSSWGHAYDFVCDTLVTPLFFLTGGIGLVGTFGWPAVACGAIAGAAILTSNIVSELAEQRMGPGRRIHEGGGGFDLDDLLYLLGPAAALSWLGPFIAGAAIGAPVMLVVTWLKARRLDKG
jgi:phosphatidylglycerophosphate synthase